MKKDTHKKSMLKSLIWRIMGVIWLAGITWIFTRSWITVSLVTFIHHGVFLFVFWAHERLWFLVNWVSKWKHFVKALTYEVVLGNLILGLITYVITGNIKQMTLITLTYIQSKILLYFCYDFLWTKHITK